MGKLKGQKEYKKFQEGGSLSPKQAILAQCFVCNGKEEGSGEDCKGENCPLYGFFRKWVFKGRQKRSKSNVGAETHGLPLLKTLVIFILMTLFASSLWAETGTASYYTRASCLREGTSGICANGEVLNDNDLTAASWFYRFGTILLVTNLSNGKQVKVRVNDRGPAKRLVRQGRVLDLSRAAFLALDKLSKGIINVKVERVK